MEKNDDPQMSDKQANDAIELPKRILRIAPIKLDMVFWLLTHQST
jgi:hypothetical protein